jgi:hypothetical protein
LKKLIRNLLVFVLLIAVGAAALPFILNDDEDYEARLVGAILFVEEALEEGASGSHHRLYEPNLSALSGDNSWKLEAKIRSTDEFNQEKFGNLSARLTTLCRPYSLAACWRLENLMIDGALAELETAEAGEPDPTPDDGDRAAEGDEVAEELSAGNAGEVPESLDELEAVGEEPAQETEVAGESSEAQSTEKSEPQETTDTAAADPGTDSGADSGADSAADSGESGNPERTDVADAQPAQETQGESQLAEQPAIEVSKDVVALVQRQLDRLGYIPGPADGVIGPRTESAIKAYQEDHQLPSDGRITDDLLRLLEIPQTANSN